MKRTFTATTASTLLLMTTTAFADNISGIHAGGSVTLAETVAGLADETANSANPGESSTVGASDQLGSVDLKVGYNQVLENSIFVGVEANYNLTGIDENVIDEENNVVDLSKESSYGIRGKIGSAISDNVALYGIIGYQMTEFEVTVADEGDTFPEAKDHTGIVYGIGATYAVMPNFLLTAEATQTDLGDETYFQETDVGVDETQFGIGLAYRFDI